MPKPRPTLRAVLHRTAQDHEAALRALAMLIPDEYIRHHYFHAPKNRQPKKKGRHR